jgi:hypothetical protein
MKYEVIKRYRERIAEKQEELNQWFEEMKADLDSQMAELNPDKGFYDGFHGLTLNIPKDELEDYRYSNEVTLEPAITRFIEDNLRDYFPMNDWDDPDYYVGIATIDGVDYHVEIEEGDCIESTCEHRIVLWGIKVERIDKKVTPYWHKKDYQGD